jgi:hypothetical protein
MEWTSSYIRTFFFPRGSVPSDITSGSPNPSGWGTPAALFEGNCNIDSHFGAQQIVSLTYYSSFSYVLFANVSLP